MKDKIKWSAEWEQIFADMEKHSNEHAKRERRFYNSVIFAPAYTSALEQFIHYNEHLQNLHRDYQNIPSHWQPKPEKKKSQVIALTQYANDELSTTVDKDMKEILENITRHKTKKMFEPIVFKPEHMAPAETKAPFTTQTRTDRRKQERDKNKRK